MKIALTGGTGFLGGAVLAEAAARGWRVNALTRRDQPPRDGVDWVAGTLDDTAALAALADGADAMIHCAGVVNTPDMAQFTQANVFGTANVLAAAAGCRRFVFVSSLSARRPGLSFYGTSKLRAEQLVGASTLDWTVVRPPWIYGPGDADSLDLFKAARRGVVPVPGTRGARVSMIHVADLARLLCDLAPADEAARRRRYEPDDGHAGGWSHGEVAAMLGDAVDRRARALPLPGWVMRGGALLDRALRGPRARLTMDRVSYMLHPDWVVRGDARPPASLWVPEIATPQGLAATAAWYRGAGWL